MTTGSIVFVDLQTAVRRTDLKGRKTPRTTLVFYETQDFALPSFSNWGNSDGYYDDGFFTMKGSRANLVMELSYIKDMCPYHDVTVITTDPELGALLHARFAGWTVETDPKNLYVTEMKKEEEDQRETKKPRLAAHPTFCMQCGVKVHVDECYCSPGCATRADDAKGEESGRGNCL